jgi:hypothetical protein
MAINPNMIAIQTVTIGAGGASQIQFTSIPQTYTDLLILVSGRTTATNQTVSMQFNSDTTATNYRRFALGCDSNNLFSQNINDRGIGYISMSTDTTNAFGSMSIYIPQYRSGNPKTYLTDSARVNNSTSAWTLGMITCYWSGTAAISSITVTNAGNWTQYSTATLYGVTSAAIGAKATGGIITQDANYMYHTFLSSGTFTPTQTISADYLVVAGGGGGGGQQGGGGGAGGVRAVTAQSLTAQAYTVTVGGGGNGGNWSTNSGVSSGSASTFNSYSASGGGYGGANGVSYSGANGGSGGGGGINGAVNGNGNSGSYSPVEGYAGGATASGDGGAGGGGAGGAGTAKIASSGNGKDGGVGASSYNSIDFSSWLTVTNTGSNGKVGGGGGGGTSGGRTGGYGGTGGGGNGYNAGVGPVSSQNGLANTGGGAGGGSQGNNTSAAYGGNGGSGLVIIRYAK